MTDGSLDSCRYSRCIPALSEEELALLRTRKAAVIGCGGLGGFILEMLARIGIGSLAFADPDVFEPSNLNRQRFSSELTIGEGKAMEAELRLREINSDVKLEAFPVPFSRETAGRILEGCDIVLDALDSGSMRRVLADECSARNLTLVHGAVSEWSAQVCTVPPGSGIMDLLYSEQDVPERISSLPFLPPLCASIQVSEAVRFLAGKPCALEGVILFLDAESMTVQKSRVWAPEGTKF